MGSNMAKKHKRWDSFKLFVSIFSEVMFEGEMLDEFKKDKEFFVKSVILFGGIAVIIFTNLLYGINIISMVVDIVLWFLVCVLVSRTIDRIRGKEKNPKREIAEIIEVPEPFDLP